MCGITGTVGIGDLELVRQMTALINYRGPDDQGLYEDGDVRLGHCRLSIMDLSSAGHQPMLSDDGELVITYNGEVYNYQELREQLQKQGYRFQTGTEMETILYAYREWGIDCLRLLEGMFAFALWDRKKRELLLARDRTGIKPLFYYKQNDGLAFASELKPLLLVPGLERRVNRRALRSVIRYASNIENESMIASVHKLPPAHWLIWRQGKCELGKYWTHPAPAPERWNEPELEQQLRATLTEVVRSHMVSNVPVGAALSGGLDSSGIVALMSQGNHSDKIETFTVGHGTDDPDLITARQVADHYRTNHHEILISAENVADLLPRIIWHLEEPMGHMETVQIYATCQAAARSVKVLLFGDGADECFGGYARYKLLHPRVPLPLAVCRDLYGHVYQNGEDAKKTSSGKILSRFMWGKVPESPLLDPHPRPAPPMIGMSQRTKAIESAMNYDQRTILPNLYLKRADALGMANSLEIRVPFLDRRVVELSSRIPAGLMVRAATEKYILRRALGPLLPEGIAWRPKRPQQMQVNGNLVSILELLAHSLLRPSDVRARGFFDPARVDELLRVRPKGRSSIELKMWSWRVWVMIQCELWARIFLDRPISTNIPSVV